MVPKRLQLVWVLLGVAIPVGHCTLSRNGSRSTCSFSYATQHSYSSANLTGTGVDSHDIWYVNGDTLGGGPGKTIESFIAEEEEDVRKSWQDYVAHGAGRNISSGFNTTNSIILDIENPVNLKLLGNIFYANGSEVFHALINAIAMRVRITHELFPQAKVGIYGSPNGPNSFKGENFTISMQGYHMAMRAGMFDQVDFLVPVLYFGANESDPRHDDMFAFTHTTMKAACTIVKADGSPIPIYANTKFTYHHNGSMVEADTTHKLIAELETYARLAKVVYWFFPDFYHDQPCSDPKIVEMWFRSRKPVPSSCFNASNTPSEHPLDLPTTMLVI